MTETPRDREPEDAGPLGGAPGADRAGAADEPVTGAPAGAAESAAESRAAAGGKGGRRRGAGLLGWLRPPRVEASPVGPEADPVQRRRRRWFVAAVSAGAAFVVVALCAGAVSVVSAVTGFRDRAGDVRDERRTRADDCLALEQRLNKLNPPGAAAGPAARAVAVRDENAAVRIYVDQLGTERGRVDGWRELLDARTAYAEGLDVQVSSKTPAFFVAPRAGDGGALTEQLIRRSPESCAGSIRRLGSPDL